MSQVSYCTRGFNDRDVEAALDAIAAAGFDRAEILVVATGPPVGHAIGGELLCVQCWCIWIKKVKV